MAFVKATKDESKLKLAIEGPSGSGKTLTALLIGQAMCSGPGKLALVDTENKSASKYCEIVPFAADAISGDFHPRYYISKIKEATEAGFEVLVIDSLSHAWFGPGGILELTDKATGTGGNKFGGWKTTTPIQTELSQAIIQADIHIIGTMRTHAEWVLEENAAGKKVPRKVGTKVVQRQDLDYEFDVVGRLDDSHDMTIVKTRCSDLDGKSFHRPGKDVAEILLRWLKGEKPVPPAPPPTDLDAIRAFAKERYGIKNAAQLDAWLSTEGLTRDAAFERWRGELGVAA